MKELFRYYSGLLKLTPDARYHLYCLYVFVAAFFSGPVIIIRKSLKKLKSRL